MILDQQPSAESIDDRAEVIARGLEDLGYKDGSVPISADVAEEMIVHAEMAGLDPELAKLLSDTSARGAHIEAVRTGEAQPADEVIGRQAVAGGVDTQSDTLKPMSGGFFGFLGRIFDLALNGDD